MRWPREPNLGARWFPSRDAFDGFTSVGPSRAGSKQTVLRLPLSGRFGEPERMPAGTTTMAAKPLKLRPASSQEGQQNQQNQENQGSEGGP